MHLGAGGMGQQSLGDRSGGLDLGKDLPDDLRTLLMDVSPPIDLV
jgi:hypothetical protein